MTCIVGLKHKGDIYIGADSAGVGGLNIETRVDSQIGYLENNVVPACQNCNYAKRSMGYEEFKEWVKQIYNNLFKD